MMFRWPLLLLLVVCLNAEESAPMVNPGIPTAIPVAPSADPVAAPEIDFRCLEWWVPNHHGVYGWYGGQDLTPIPLVMGRIEALRITGIQELVWEHAYYRVQGVMRLNERTWFLGFEKGTLKLRHLEHRRWQVEFTPMDSDRPTRIFRTNRPEFGSIDPP
jgi:hypothetical protein